jgi:hypothetical protein
LPESSWSIWLAASGVLATLQTVDDIAERKRQRDCLEAARRAAETPGRSLRDSYLESEELAINRAETLRLQNTFVVLKLRFERRMGVLLGATEPHAWVSFDSVGRGDGLSEPQKVARVPDDGFEQWIAEKEAAGEKPRRLNSGGDSEGPTLRSCRERRV